MNALKLLISRLFGYHYKDHGPYDPQKDSVVKRYNRIEYRMSWMPRDLLDIGK